MYTQHKNRPNLRNYTADDYIGVCCVTSCSRFAYSIFSQEFSTVANRLTNTSAGNILDHHNIGGPTICCNWVSCDIYVALICPNFIERISPLFYLEATCLRSITSSNILRWCPFRALELEQLIVHVHSLQHYPQNNCFGSYKYELPYYLQHAQSNVRSTPW